MHSHPNTHPPTHAHLHLPGDTAIHRIDAVWKVVGVVGFATAVAITPRTMVWAFAIDALVAAIVIGVARVPVRTLLGRLAVLAPFLSFAVLVPFIGGGEQVDVVGVRLSEPGLWAAFNVIAKASLGATASIVLTATTPLPDIIAALTRLRVPTVVVAIIAFMFRYLDLVADGLQRMRLAMTARGHDPRWLWQAKPIAQSAGTLFVRSYERGERIHLAMVARGFDGSMPALTENSVPARTSGRDHSWIAVGPAFIAASAAVIGLIA